MSADLPEMEFAIATVKLLIECAGFDPSLYAVRARFPFFLYIVLLVCLSYIVLLRFLQKALDLGSDLLQEDDENVELW